MPVLMPAMIALQMLTSTVRADSPWAAFVGFYGVQDVEQCMRNGFNRKDCDLRSFAIVRPDRDVPWFTLSETSSYDVKQVELREGSWRDDSGIGWSAEFSRPFPDSLQWEAFARHSDGTSTRELRLFFRDAPGREDGAEWVWHWYRQERSGETLKRTYRAFRLASKSPL